ncbi:MAG: CoA transferase [Pseudomonadota bacterium]|nr:CoA transferase [Pseudomonadota bacterium]
MTGSLAGIRIIEFAAIGPAPFCGMMLGDHGAEVIRVDRPGGTHGGVDIANRTDVLARNRASIIIDLKKPEGASIARQLIRTADGLIEGFRPGVMERLGLGPEILLDDNPRLIYGRMTGWGQTGPYAKAAGHDINYIALSGALHGYGRAGDKPTPPINAVGDFGGGGMLLAFAMLAGILHAKAGGKGQVIDCAMTEGAAILSAMTWGLYAQGSWRDERGTNSIDTGSHYYDTYETADGKWIAIGAIEPEFYAQLRRSIGLQDDPEFEVQRDPILWPAFKDKLAMIFALRTRAEWCALMEYSDCCFAPVLSLAEAPRHPHAIARKSFIEVDEVLQPAPAPRFSVTDPPTPQRPPRPGADTDRILRSIAVDAHAIAELRKSATVA